MGRMVGDACGPNKVGSSRSRPIRGVSVAVRCEGRFQGEELQKTSLCIPTILIEGYDFIYYSFCGLLVITGTFITEKYVQNGILFLPTPKGKRTMKNPSCVRHLSSNDISSSAG